MAHTAVTKNTAGEALKVGESKDEYTSMLLIWACSFRISTSEIQHVYHLTPLRGKRSSAHNKQHVSSHAEIMTHRCFAKLKLWEQEKKTAAWMDPSTCDRTLCSPTPAATQCLCVTRVVLVCVVVESSALRVELGLTEHLTAALVSTGEHSAVYRLWLWGDDTPSAHSLDLQYLTIIWDRNTDLDSVDILRLFVLVTLRILSLSVPVYPCWPFNNPIHERSNGRILECRVNSFLFPWGKKRNQEFLHILNIGLYIKITVTQTVL